MDQGLRPSRPGQTATILRTLGSRNKAAHDSLETTYGLQHCYGEFGLHGYVHQRNDLNDRFVHEPNLSILEGKPGDRSRLRGMTSISVTHQD